MQTDIDKGASQPSGTTDPTDVCLDATAEGNSCGKVLFEDLFDLGEIQHLQDLFADAEGVACQILRPDGTFITERSNYCHLCGDIIRCNKKGLAKCTASDSKLGKINSEGLNIYRCESAGLLEAGAPIFIEGRHIATWGLGQVRDGTQDEAGIRAFAREIDADEDAVADAFNEVTVMSRERFEKVARLMQGVAKQLASVGYRKLQQARVSDEREQVQRHFEEREQQLSSFMDNLPGMAYRCLNSHGWPMLFVNRGCISLAGYTPAELTGTGGIVYGDLIHPDDRQMVWLRIQEAVKNEEQFVIEYRIYNKAGEEHSVCEQGRAVAENDDGVTILEGFIYDITELRDVQSELYRERERLALASQAARLGVWDLDLLNNKLIWDDRMFELYGRDRSDFKGAYECWQAGVHPDDLERASREVEQAVSGDKPFDTEFRVVHPGGIIRHLRAFATVSRDEQGQAVRMTGVNYDITDLKVMQRWLQKSEAHYRLLADNTLDVIWTMDMNLVFTYVNTSVYDLTGYTPDEWIGSRLPDHCTPGSFANMQKIIEAEISRGGGHKRGVIFETELVCKDGSMVDVEIHGKVSFDLNGNPVMLQGTTRDISKRKQADAELAKQKQMLELVIESAPVNIFWKDVNSVYTGCNRMFLASAGKQNFNEVIGKTDLDMVWGGEYQKYIDDDKAVMTSGKPKLKYEENYTLPDGTEVWWQTSKIPLKDDKGKVLGLLALSEDITEQRQVKIDLQNERDRLDYIIKASRLGTWTWNLRDNTTVFNDMWFSLLGYTMEELGPACYELWKSLGHPDDVAKIEGLLRKCASGEMLDYSSEFRMKHKDGHWVWILDRGSVMTYDADGRPLEMFGTHTDITHMMQMEKQLAMSQKLEAVGQLAGGVAHDFNNLLMGIMGYTQLSLDKIGEDHPIRKWLEEVMREAKRSADIVRQLLAFSRRQTIMPRILNINDAVSNMLKMLRRLIGEDIDLLWQPGASLGLINIDPSQVDQILANLCVNARDAIGGVGKITIETESVILDADYCAAHLEVTPGAYVMLAVSDNGCGMDEETLENIFEPFFTTKEVGEGTGLGLATIYGIVKQNKGSVSVYSEIGGGTTFRIYLPCCESDGVSDAEDAENSVISGGNETILIVEDQESICKTIAMFLEPLGYSVLVAETPDRALAIMSDFDGELDMLVTDVVMPGMNGRELAEKLLEMMPRMKVLYMSGYTSNVIAHRGVLDDGVNFLSKPISRDQLALKIRKILDEN